MLVVTSRGAWRRRPSRADNCSGMKLGLDSWAAHLRGRELAPAYLVSGDEPLQLGEAVDSMARNHSAF
jgi:hypothetical protein